MKSVRPDPAANGGIPQGAASAGGGAGRGDMAAADRRRARSPRRLALARAAAAAVAAVLVVVLALAAGEERGTTITLAAGPEQPAAAQAAEAMPASTAAAGPVSAPATATPPAQPVPPESDAAPRAGPGAAADAEAAAAASAPRAAGPDEALAQAPDRGASVRLPRAATAGAGRGYFVQLGVFTDPANALELYERAAAAGQPAHIQSRVVLGPFPDRAAAERARKAHQALGAGVVLAPGRGR